VIVKFENYDRRINKINNVLKKYGINNLEEAQNICLGSGLNIKNIIKNIQPIAFDDAIWAYIVGAAIAIKKNINNASDIAKMLGIGLQSFCIPGSVAEHRLVGIGHGNLASSLLTEQTRCFCFLAGHESFAAAEGALSIIKAANKVRNTKLQVILNGLGKDAAYIISRINGFTYIKTKYDYLTSKLHIIEEILFSKEKNRVEVKVYGADDVNEGVAIMISQNVDISITGNSTNPTRFQHPVAGTYKKWTIEHNKHYFSVASGGGTGRTLHPDNIASGPASYGLTDVMGRMHSDVQFAGSSSVPSHVEMMGFIGMGNNPIVGASVSIAVAIEEIIRHN
jgi:hypothetical protein